MDSYKQINIKQPKPQMIIQDNQDSYRVACNCGYVCPHNHKTGDTCPASENANALRCFGYHVRDFHRAKKTEKLKTPVLDKMSEVSVESNSIGQFLDWMTTTKGVVLSKEHVHSDNCYEEGKRGLTCGYGTCRYCDEEVSSLECIHPSFEVLLAEYFEIDLAKAERERVSILTELRRK